MAKKHNVLAEGKKSYAGWKKELMNNAKYRKVYQEEAAKKELWLQLLEARQKAGLTQQEVAKRLGVSQAQVARIEKRGYETYTLTSLRRYIQALGEEFSLRVTIHQSSNQHEGFTPAA